jgi:hypothetical protein
VEFVRAALEREIGRDAKSDLDVIREFTHTQRSVEIGVGERAFMPSARTNRFVDTYSFTRSIQRSRRKGRWPADLLARVMASGARCKRAKPQ